VGVHVVKTVTAQVAHEVSLSLGILARPQSVDNVFILIDEDAAAGAAIGADALLALKKPDPLFIEKVLAAQGPDRAEIDHVPSQFVVERLARKDINLRMIAPVDDLELGGAADFTGEAHAARAHDAAIGKEGNRIADIGFVRWSILDIDHPALR